MKSFRIENKCLLIVIGISIILGIVPISLGLDNGYARIVYNVTDIQEYKLHWNDRFPPNSTLKIYAEADGINHKRAVGVDYVFIIKDSNDNIIDTIVYENRYKDYRENDFIVYSKEIDKDWDDGTYIAEVHIFDLLNESIMFKHYQNVSKALLEGDNEEPDIPYMNRSDISNSTELKNRQYKEIIQNFYVDKYSNKYPANRFMIENMAIDRFEISPGVPIQLNATIKNNFYDIGFASLDLMVDNKTIDNATIEIEPYSSKNITLIIPSETTETFDFGDHILEAIPTSDNTIGFDLYAAFKVIEMEAGVPARFQYKDLKTEKLLYSPNETINITVTAKNRGRAGSRSIGLAINDEPIQEKTVFLNFLEEKEINFSITEEEIGQYRLTIDNSNLSKIIIVEYEEGVTLPAKAEIEEKGISKVIIVLGLSILVILLYIFRKKFIAKRLSEIE